MTAHVKDLQELPMCTGVITCRLHARLLEEGRGHQAAPPGLVGLKPQAKALSKEDHLLTGKGLNRPPAQAFLLFFFSAVVDTIMESSIF